MISSHLSLITPCYCFSCVQSIAAEEQQQQEVSFAAQPGDGGAGAGASGGAEARNIDGPKVSLEELMSYVRNSKVNLLKEALDYLPTKKFDKSLVQVGGLLTMPIISYPEHLNVSNNRRNRSSYLMLLAGCLCSRPRYRVRGWIRANVIPH
jgi:hypothetical protein